MVKNIKNIIFHIEIAEFLVKIWSIVPFLIILLSFSKLNLEDYAHV
jgi:hypothetical protein